MVNTGDLFPYAPSEKELDLGAEAEKRNKLAKLSSYHVRIFNMSDSKDVDEYEKLMLKMFVDIQARRCVVWAKERTLIDGSWKIYLEWSTYSTSKDNENE